MLEKTSTSVVFIEEDGAPSVVDFECETFSGCREEEIKGKKRWTGDVAEDDLEEMGQYGGLHKNDLALVPETYKLRFVDRAGKIKKTCKS